MSPEANVLTQDQQERKNRLFGDVAINSKELEEKIPENVQKAFDFITDAAINSKELEEKIPENVQKAFDFITKEGWGECGETYLNRPCLVIKKVAEKYEIPDEKVDLLIKLTLEKFANYMEFTHPIHGRILMPKY